MDQEQQSRRWLTRKRVLWTVCIIAVIVGAYVLLRFAYVREWDWTGLVKNPDYHKRTLWDWLSLLVVPAVLALGGYFFTRSENRRTREEADRQRSLDRFLADERRQDDMLQAYLDGMSQQLTDKERPLQRARLGDYLSTVARARTLTVLPRLDGDRKARVVQFLYESGLIARDRPILALNWADLSGVVLINTFLSGANLSGANLYTAVLSGSLREADLSGAILDRAYLQGADLSGANLGPRQLSEAELRWARARVGLFGVAKGQSQLIDADLRGADLRGAILSDAFLLNADLRYADLTGVVGVAPYKLAEQTSLLEGATMPNGQKYEDWIKDRDGSKAEEND